eukprot:NODE_134_length_18141_cov_0.186066.p9 type:complete len:168 gc:universal NODE_134_length_18141_cov_0.186066:1547-1044(-)
MGNDGGSIQNRSELIKTKEIDRSKKDIDDLEEYYTCAISKQDLEEPIVCCKLGKLYNRNALIQYMIDKKEGTKLMSGVADHVRSLKQITLLKMSNPKTYTCPITNRRFGRGAFVYLDCGCVFSKQRFKTCPKCNQESKSTTVINPINSDLVKQLAKLEKKKKKFTKN